LPEGEEPEYFAQLSCGYRSETEAERAAEDVSQCLRYAQTVNSAVWDMLNVAKCDHSDLPPGKEASLDRARSLCFLLRDLTSELDRRVGTLFSLIGEQTIHKNTGIARRAHPSGEES
jgi:hypothetical protein